MLAKYTWFTVYSNSIFFTVKKYSKFCLNCCWWWRDINAW